MVDKVDLRIVRALEHDLLRTVVAAEDLRMHEHCAGGGGVEPPQVQHRLRFAGADKMPLTVGPGLHPGVVVIRMGPARGIDLTGRDTHAAECRHAEGGLLPASAQGIAHRGQRTACPGVGRLIGHLLVAPVVHLQDGLRHGHSLHAGLQFPEKHHPGRIQVLVVDPDGQYKVAELPFRYLPTHLFTDPERSPYLIQIILRRIVHRIRKRHVRIQELQRLPFSKRWPVGAGHDGPVAPDLTFIVIPGLTGNLREAGQRAPVRRHPGLKVLLHLRTVRRVRHEMRLPPAGAGRDSHPEKSPKQGLQEKIL